MKEKVLKLYNKDDKKSYSVLLELEIDATDSDELYNYFDELIKMLSNDKSFIRVRGFRLIMSLSKWDKDNKINKNINTILDELDDDVSTSVRQCLSKLNILLLYKPELSDIVLNKINNININKYKSTMQSLIKKDIDNIRNNM